MRLQERNEPSLPSKNSRAAFPSLSRADLATLAEVGALNSIGEGSHRRDALWQVQRAGRQAGPLLEPLDQDEEQTSPLQAMNPEERMVADYAGTGVTVGRHPMAHCRGQLRNMNVCRADDLRMLRHGINARIAGCVSARQRPGTAHGFIFLSIEDETGISNAIIDPEMYERKSLTGARRGSEGIRKRPENRIAARLLDLYWTLI